MVAMDIEAGIEFLEAGAESGGGLPGAARCHAGRAQGATLPSDMRYEAAAKISL